LISGYSGSGKTTLLEGLAEELVRRGYKVASVKHVGDGSSLLRRDKDSGRHALAGAVPVVISSDRETAIVFNRRMELEEIVHLVGEVDFLLAEGFKNRRGFPRIAIARSEKEYAELVDEFTMAVVGEFSKEKPPAYSFSEIAALADLVVEKATAPLPGINCGQCGFSACEEFLKERISGGAKGSICPVSEGKITLLADGKPVYLKPFVQNILHDVIGGLVRNIKGTKGKKIEILLRE